jgi:hypothetical protein
MLAGLGAEVGDASAVGDKGKLRFGRVDSRRIKRRSTPLKESGERNGSIGARAL